jgi:hypothetical protein
MSDNLSIFNNFDLEIKDYLKQLLVFCGYDTPNLLLEICDENLVEMEIYIREKMGKNNSYDSPQILQKYFGGTIVTFEEIRSFSFNPGARKTLLFHLPKAVKKFKSRLVQKKHYLYIKINIFQFLQKQEMFLTIIRRKFIEKVYLFN